MRWLFAFLLLVPMAYGLQLSEEGLVLSSTTAQKVIWTDSYFIVGEECSLSALSPQGTLLDEVQLCNEGGVLTDLDVVDSDTLAVTLTDKVVLYEIRPALTAVGEVPGGAAAVANGILIVNGISYSLPGLSQLSSSQGIEPLIGSRRLVAKDGSIYTVSSDGSLAFDTQLPGTPIAGVLDQGRIALTFASPNRLAVYDDGDSFELSFVRTTQQPCCPGGIGLAGSYLAAGREVWAGSEKIISAQQIQGSAISHEGVLLAITAQGVRKYVVEEDDALPDDGFPAPPPAPDPAGVPGEAILHMIIPSIVPATFTAEIFHTGPREYVCSVHQGDTPITDEFTLAGGEAKQLFFEDLSPGTYTVDAECSVSEDILTTRDTFEVIEDESPLLLLGVPLQAQSPFNVTMEHTSDEELMCTIGIDIEEDWGEWSDPFQLSPGYYVEVSFSEIADGIHTIYGECETSEGNITAQENVAVGPLDFCESTADCSAGEVCSIDGICMPAQSYSIVITEPAAIVHSTHVNVTYRHTALDTRACITTINSHSWSADDPRWDDIPIRDVEPGESRVEQFADLSEQTHIASVLCTDLAGGQIEEAVTAFEISLPLENITGDVGITLLQPPSEVEYGFNVSFLHNASQAGTCKVSIGGTVQDEDVVSPFTVTTYEYERERGTYTVAVECAGSDWRSVASKQVHVNTSSAGYDPSISAKLVLEEWEAFTVHGIGFIPNDDIRLYLVGGGTTVQNVTLADSSGAFDFTYPGIEQGTYSILAESESDDNVQAATSIDVRLESPREEPDDLPRIGPTDEQPKAVPDESQTVRTQIQKAPQPSRSSEQEPEVDVDESHEESSIWWWIAPLLLFLIIGGLFGWFVYNGSLDVSSWNGFQQSLRGLFSGSLSFESFLHKEKGPLSSFIESERAKGYTDEQIRAALVKKGWDEDTVENELSG